MCASENRTCFPKIVLVSLIRSLLLFFRLPQLEIEKTRTEDCTNHYHTGELAMIVVVTSLKSSWYPLTSPGTFTCLAAVFKMKRSPGYHVFSTYIPSVLIVIMSWIRWRRIRRREKQLLPSLDSPWLDEVTQEINPFIRIFLVQFLDSPGEHPSQVRRLKFCKMLSLRLCYGRRVTLGVTSLLTLATLNTQTQQSLPPVSYTKVSSFHKW